MSKIIVELKIPKIRDLVFSITYLMYVVVFLSFSMELLNRSVDGGIIGLILKIFILIIVLAVLPAYIMKVVNSLTKSIRRRD